MGCLYCGLDNFEAMPKVEVWQVLDDITKRRLGPAFDKLGAVVNLLARFSSGSTTVTV